MRKCLFLAVLTLTAPALAQHTAQQALNQNKKLAAAVDAIKAAAGVECEANDSALSSQIMGPEGKNAFTQQIPCYDPAAFNPSQLGQLVLTYYGTEQNGALVVGDLVKVEFEVFK